MDKDKMRDKSHGRIRIGLYAYWTGVTGVQGSQERR